MAPQVDKGTFTKALKELGHDPRRFIGQKLSLDGMAKLYNLEEDQILDAIDRKAVSAHYDYSNDTIWIDALDAAHFYFCIRNEAHLYSSK